MVCYARPASRLVAIIFVAWLVFAVPARHLLSTAALATAVLVAATGAAVAAAVAIATFTSVKRRRAAAGGCVTCQFRCQQAMTEPARRLRLVTTTERSTPGQRDVHEGQEHEPTRSASVLLPTPTARSAEEDPGPAAPRWPDRPAYRAGRLLQRPADGRTGSADGGS